MSVRIIIETDSFKKAAGNLDNSYKPRLEKLITKICETPDCGKPMRFTRKGTREIYLSPFSFSYAYLKDEDKIILLDIYHKDKQ